MSRNFELLQQAAREDLLTPPGVVLPLELKASTSSVVSGPANGEIATLVQRLFFIGGKVTARRVVSFSGVARDDRTSWICARAAESLGAQTDTSVCVVDANFRPPQLHIHLGVDSTDGLAAALTSSAPIRNFLQPLSPGNVWLLPSGSSNGNISTQVDRLRTRFAELRDQFNFILVSAPSLACEAEAIVMGQLADGIVLIVEANQTRRDTARQVKDHLAAAQVPVLGAVLDQRTFPIPEFLYRRL